MCCANGSCCSGRHWWEDSGVHPGSSQVEFRGVVDLAAGLAAHLPVAGVGAVLIENLHPTEHRLVSFTAKS